MIEGDKGSLLPPFLRGDSHWESDGARTMIEGDKGFLLPPFLSGDFHWESDGATDPEIISTRTSYRM